MHTYKWIILTNLSILIYFPRSNSVSNMPTPTAAAGSPFHTRRARPRKNSWSHDSDSGMSSNEESCISGGSTLNLSMSASYHPAYTLRPPKYPNRRESPSQIEIVTPSPLLPVGGGTPWVGGVVGGAGEEGGLDAVYLKNLKINSAIREIFANRFVHMFASYDHFLSQPNEVGLPLNYVVSIIQIAKSLHSCRTLVVILSTISTRLPSFPTNPTKTFPFSLVSSRHKCLHRSLTGRLLLWEVILI